jgi:hypothetical protein
MLTYLFFFLFCTDVLFELIRMCKEFSICGGGGRSMEKRVIRVMAGVNSRTSCRQLLKKVNILTSSLYILEVTCFIKRYCQSLELNANAHHHNTRRKMDIHIKSHRTNLYKNSVINMGSKVYNKLPDHMKEIDSYTSF